VAKFVLKGVRLFAGGADLTGVSNSVEVNAEIAEQEATAFNPSDSDMVWREVLAGLASTSISAEGQWEAGDAGMVDDASWAGLGGVGPWTICPRGASTVGDLAWVTRAMRASYALGGQVGDVAPWTASASGSWPLARGEVLHLPGAPRSADGAGAARQVGALSATRALYVTLHVLSVAGDAASITVAVESDDNAAMDTPTVRATFDAASSRGGQALAIPGPVTDDWWRVTWTVTGTSPSFLFVVAAGTGPA